MSPPPIAIRPAIAADLDGLVALLGQLFAIETDFHFDGDRQRRGLQLMLANEHGCLLATEADGQVIGMCSGQLTISTAAGGLSLLVEDVIVEAAWRGKGVGSRMLEELKKWGREKGAVRSQLLADRDNAPALRFYLARGWSATALLCLQQQD